MAKVSRDMLKTLVKECLFEILLESTGEVSTLSESRSTRVQQTKKRPAKKKAARPSLDSISYRKKRQNQAPQINIAGMTSDPIMQSIFQDTAATTLVEQHNAERGGPRTGGDAASRIVAQNDPTSLFGDAAQNWAHLAFDGEIE